MLVEAQTSRPAAAAAPVAGVSSLHFTGCRFPSALQPQLSAPATGRGDAEEAVAHQSTQRQAGAVRPRVGTGPEVPGSGVHPGWTIRVLVQPLVNVPDDGRRDDRPRRGLLHPTQSSCTARRVAARTTDDSTPARQRARRIRGVRRLPSVSEGTAWMDPRPGGEFHRDRATAPAGILLGLEGQR
jgi:hypothetical protein